MVTSEWIVLNRQPIRESDWLLDIFSEQLGRFSVVINERQLNWSVDILDHCKSEISVVKNSEANYKLHIIERLSGWQAISMNDSAPNRLSASPNISQSTFIKSACVLYVVELIQKFLPLAVPNKRLFKILCAVIDALKSDGVHDPWLRFFEYQLLVESGLGFSWQQDYQGLNIIDQQGYYFNPGFGFYDSAAILQNDSSATSLPQLFNGRDLLAISQQDFNPERLKIAKIILRYAIEHQLKTPLISRQLWLA